MSKSAPSLRYIFLNEMPAESAAWSRGSLIAAGEKVSEDFLRAAEDAVRPADRFVVVYTSGSTSAPKGVVHNHGSLLEHLRHLNKIRGYVGDETLFSNAPFFWIGGLAYGLIGALEAGCRVVYSAAATAKDLLDTIEREKPTFVTGFAQSVVHVAKEPDYEKRDLSSVRRGNMPAIMAPDARPDDLELRHNKLGSTETGSVYLTHEYEGPLPESMRGSFGKPTPGFEVRITDPDTGKGVPAGESGEIWIRGPYVMEGYLGKERHDTFTPDGWYRTGDLAQVDAEGHVFYKNRLGDMIKTSGANVSPREVEDALLDVTGQRSHVVGVTDKERGQMVVAAIISDTYTGDENAIRDQLKSKISSYKIPRRILFLKEAEVPMLSSGKLDKRTLVEMFRAS
jgi:acyl-CoA synthetase (AMP-forming)/AMP-acid ligase II